MTLQKDLILVRFISSKIRNDGTYESTRHHTRKSEDENLQNNVSYVHRTSAIPLYYFRTFIWTVGCTWRNKVLCCYFNRSFSSWEIYLFHKLNTFEELKISAINFDICLPVCTEQLYYHWKAFREIWYLNIFRNSVENVQVSRITVPLTL